MIIGATDVTVRSGPGTPQYSNSLTIRCWWIGAESEAAVLRRPVEPEPALVADLAAERGQLAVTELQVVLGQFGMQRRGDVLVEEFAHVGEPGALLRVQLEVHGRSA